MARAIAEYERVAAVRDPLQRLPDASLKRGGANVDGEIEWRRAPIHVGREAGDPGLQPPVVPRDRRRGEFRPERPLERCGAVAETDPAEAALGGGDQQPTERAGHGGEANRDARSAAAVGRGRHTEVGVRALVHAAGRAVSGLVESWTHFFPSFQLGLEPGEASLVGVLARADAQHVLKCAQQPMRRGAATRGQRRQGRGCIGVCVDEPARVPHQGHARIGDAGLSRAAAPARAESGTLGGVCPGEELDLTAARFPARAGGKAVDPGRAHAVHECAVVAAIARQHDPPAACGTQGRNGSGTAHASNVARCRAAFYPILVLEVPACPSTRLCA